MGEYLLLVCLPAEKGEPLHRQRVCDQCGSKAGLQIIVEYRFPPPAVVVLWVSEWQASSREHALRGKAAMPRLGLGASVEGAQHVPSGTQGP